MIAALAVLIVHIYGNDPLVKDGITTDACFEAKAALTDGMSLAEREARDDAAAKEEAARRDAWLKANPTAIDPCAEGQVCIPPWNQTVFGVIGAGSGHVRQPGDVEYAECLKVESK